MEKQNENKILGGCRCAEAACGCASTGGERCTCGERCACRRTCRCGGGCSCAIAAKK